MKRERGKVTLVRNLNPKIPIEEYKIKSITGGISVYSKIGNNPTKTFYVGDSLSRDEARYIFGVDVHTIMEKKE